MPRANRIDLRIDEFTDSLQNAKTGESFATDFRRATARDIAKTKNWLFDWRHELTNNEVYKLFSKDAPREIQGLISIQDRGDHIWVNLAVLRRTIWAKLNVTRWRQSLRNCVKISFDKGYEGFVAFLKRKLSSLHITKDFESSSVGRSPRMIIESEGSQTL
jgi:hypothetical protein